VAGGDDTSHFVYQGDPFGHEGDASISIRVVMKAGVEAYPK